MSEFDRLSAKIKKATDDGLIPRDLTLEERRDWVYGNCSLENEAVTREIVEEALPHAK